MNDSELIVPVEVHALMVNEEVRETHPFHRVTPNFELMLGDMKGGDENGNLVQVRGAAEYAAFDGGESVEDNAAFEGVHVRWELPEALTEGVVDESSGLTRYPLVPNRWLVVRYARVPRTDDPEPEPTAVGWVLHSDYLYSDDDGDSMEDEDAVQQSFLDPRTDPSEPLKADWLGRVHTLGPEEPWIEPEARELFLTAVGAGLPTFCAYQPYHENVFSLHDDLKDLKAGGDTFPPDAMLSYKVVGWYSDPAVDILARASDIPGLLPAGSDGSPAEVLAALNWTLSAGTVTVNDELGTAAGSHPGNMLDGREDTSYTTACPPGRGDTVTLDLGAVLRVSRVRVMLGDQAENGLWPQVRVHASTDGEDWPLAHLQDFPAGTPTLDYRPTTPIEARYLQLRVLGERAEGGPPAVIRSLLTAAAPEGASRTVFSGTALGLKWDRGGQAPQPDTRPDPNTMSIALGHSTGEAVAALVDARVDRRTSSGSPRTAPLINALYHGTLDTFDGARGDIDLDETTRRGWFSSHEGGHTWRIVPRPTDSPDEPRTPRSAPALTPTWLNQLNADQAAYDTELPILADRQWRLWTLHWLRNLPEGSRPATLPDDFDIGSDAQLDPTNPEGLAHRTAVQLTEVATLRGKLPPEPTEGRDPQDAIDQWAQKQGLEEGLRLTRDPLDSFHQPADPVLLIQNAGPTPPLTRDSDNPLPCRLPSDLLTSVKITDQWTPLPANPPTPNLEGLPAPLRPLFTELLREQALLDQAAHTPDQDDGQSALHALTSTPATHTIGPLAEYTAPWRQPWLPMLLEWKLNYFPTPHHTDEGDHWTFQPLQSDSGATSHEYAWNGTGTLKADFEPSEGDVFNRLFRSRAHLAPVTTFVTRAQLARYRDTYPTADIGALTRLRKDLGNLEILSQTLSGLNDWLLQLDGGAQVPTEPAIAHLTGQQNHVPDGAGNQSADNNDFQRRFQPVRAGQFAFTDLRIVDRFGRTVNLVTPITATEQYPVLTATVTPTTTLYKDDDFVNPERFVQLPPRLLQPTRLGFTSPPATTGPAGVIGWLLVNCLDQTIGVYGPAGEALGELRAIDTTTVYNTLPHSLYTGRQDPDFEEDHRELSRFLTALIERDDDETPADAFRALMATIEQSLDDTLEPALEGDQLPGRLIGRPVALVRADLTLQLKGPPLADPSWSTALDHLDAQDPPAPPAGTWPIRLGDPHDLEDGLIGYFNAIDPDQDVDYTRLRAIAPAIEHPYIPAIGNGDDLALPVRPVDDPTTRHVTLLTDPHLPVHATTGILPVHALRLDADPVHQALAAVHASFRLNPLLAPARDPRTATTNIPGHSNSTPQAGPVHRVLDGDENTWYESGDTRTPRVQAGDWVQIDLGTQRPITHIHVLMGDPEGNRTAPAKTLQASTDTATWTDLATATATTTDLHWPPPTGITTASPLTARYLRLTFTEDADTTTVIRDFTVTPTPPGAVVIPPLSDRYGTWTWAQPAIDPLTEPLLAWDERTLITADQLSHPDDPHPTARAGYLQLHPAPSDTETNST